MEEWIYGLLCGCLTAVVLIGVVLIVITRNKQ